MKILVPCLFAISFAVVCFGQSDRKVVVWGGDKDCGFKRGISLGTDKLLCGSLKTERGQVSTVSLNDVGIAVAFLEHNDHMIAAVQLTNDTGEAVVFDSDDWGAAHFKTRKGYFAGEKPILAETSIPTRDTVRGLMSKARLNNSLETFMGDLQRTGEVREIRRDDGTRVRTTVIVPDKEAQNAAERQNVNRTESIAGEAKRLRETALTSKSVPASGSVRGLVYFRRVAEAEFVVFSLRVAGDVFVFLLPKANTPRS